MRDFDEFYIKNKQQTMKPISISTVTLGVLVILGLIILCMWGCPQYNVYSQRKEGEAQLAHATFSREVAVAEAKAKMEGATLLAQADTIRAHGVARSNEIIGASLRNNEAYLHWLWIDNIEKNPQATIYIPTEANLPIFEAGRLNKQIRERELQAADSVKTQK